MNWEQNRPLTSDGGLGKRIRRKPKRLFMAHPFLILIIYTYRLNAVESEDSQEYVDETDGETRIPHTPSPSQPPITDALPTEYAVTLLYLNSF